MAKFTTAVGTTPYVVNVTDDAVTAHRANDTGLTWKFDRDLKPVSFKRDHGGSELSYSIDKASVSNLGLGAITATDEHGVSIPRAGNGVGAIPEALEAISKVSADPKFPQELAEKVPAAFKNLGLPEPQLQR